LAFLPSSGDGERGALSKGHFVEEKRRDGITGLTGYRREVLIRKIL
jgi:hypothetical protein